MAKKWRLLLEKYEKIQEEIRRQEDQYPPITKIPPEVADSQRVFTMVGTRCVSCSIPCFGTNIPKEYNHVGWANSFEHGVKVEDYDNLYLANKCNLTNKLCVTRDERLRKAGERI